MSLILEALRKSEAERQRGRAPGLFVEQRPAAARPRGVPAWAWAVAVLLVAVLAAWGWREWDRSTAVVDAPAAVPPAVDPAPVREPPTPSAMAPDATASNAAAAQPPAPQAAPPQATVPSPAASATAASPVAPPPLPPVPVANPAPPPSAAPSEAIGAPPAAMDPPAPFVPSLSSLAASERSRLPPLKLSMHVFAETPAQRFVILDGQRLGEGASPASGLVVEEIRRDGLVLAVDGQRFLLPRP